VEGVYDCYFFEKNLQGDIISIFDTTGYKIGAYNYDAWGNFTIDSAASGLEREIVYEINPFRYRGYYYDTETGGTICKVGIIIPSGVYSSLRIIFIGGFYK